MFAFINGSFIEEGEATLPIGDLAIQRGYGVFDYFRTHNNKPLFLEDYLDRFFSSAAFMYLQPAQTRGQLTAIIDALIKKNNEPASGIKMILTGGTSLDGYQQALTPNLIIQQKKLQMHPPGFFNTGIKVITHQHQRELPHVKSINYLMGVWLLHKMKSHQAADVLYHNNGEVSEFPRANVFIVTQAGKIATPAENILHGITRKKLLQIAAVKYTVEIRAVNIEEIKTAAEVFMTSTTKRLLPVTQVDDVVIGNGKAGPITTLLNTGFISMEEGYLNNYSNH